MIVGKQKEIYCMGRVRTFGEEIDSNKDWEILPYLLMPGQEHTHRLTTPFAATTGMNLRKPGRLRCDSSS